jgi:hypothetical protein
MTLEKVFYIIISALLIKIRLAYPIIILRCPAFER